MIKLSAVWVVRSSTPYSSESKDLRNAAALMTVAAHSSERNQNVLPAHIMAGQSGPCVAPSNPLPTHSRDSWTVWLSCGARVSSKTARLPSVPNSADHSSRREVSTRDSGADSSRAAVKAL